MDGEQESSAHPVQGTTLIPPRLSLQSKAMTAVQSGSFVEDATRTHTTEEQSTPVAVTGQNANLLARFAQRITTSLAAFGTAMHPEVFPPSLLDDEKEQPHQSQTKESLTVSQQMPVTAMTPQPQKQESGSGDICSISTTNPSSTGAPPAVVKPVQGQRRLAGRAGKIRLETAVLPTPQQLGQKEEVQRPEKSERASVADLVAVNVSGSGGVATSSHLPTVSKLGETGGGTTTSTHLPALDKYKGEVGAAARGALSGSGVVECGQQEVIMTNKYVTTSSIVLVMLTKDPGPVVVQYISLQPQVGFTIHLTAPAAMKASFNYVVLLGELF
ncbi:hypothetical protein KSF_008640 [Reticulibacter mediterranei]|uniref:Uncharacterized protein n=1 Tax=Reticulibacter mediterranei TaxID=2778369 RepID=A0A8J3IJN2_9CHLR|nr:hypothetical protein KSF_008640 [Reticulibacter mediterranei]